MTIRLAIVCVLEGAYVAFLPLGRRIEAIEAERLAGKLVDAGVLPEDVQMLPSTGTATALNEEELLAFFGAMRRRLKLH